LWFNHFTTYIIVKENPIPFTKTILFENHNKRVEISFLCTDEIDGFVGENPDKRTVIRNYKRKYQNFRYYPEFDLNIEHR